MNATVRIALSELKSLFYSPIAWLLLIIFIVLTSISYTDRLANVSVLQFLGQGGGSVTFGVLNNNLSGVFVTAQRNLFYYVPLLTMGLIARELHSGSIKLLLSSPVSLTQIVLGKYLAVAGYFLLFVGFLLALTATTGLFVDHLDFALALSGMLAIYLLALAYAAVGLFMSSLTQHQVVAAISTFALLAVLTFIGQVGQRIPLVNDIAYWLSIAGRAHYMILGLVTSKDVAYFLAIITLFLSLTYLKLAAGRSFDSRALRYGRMAGVAAAVIVFGVVTSLPALTTFKDMSRTKRNSLSPGSQAVMERITGPWSATVYANVLHGEATRYLPRLRNWSFRTTFERFVFANPHFEVDYVFYWAPTENERLYARNPGKSDEELAREFAEQNRLPLENFLTREEVDAIIDLAPELYRPVYVLHWGGRSIVVRTFDDRFHRPSERDFSTGFKRLLDGGQTIAYVTGQGERSAFRRGPESHQAIMSVVSSRRAVVNLGFDIVELTLDKPVPDHVGILVLAAPKQPYSETALANLRRYIDAGRSLMILGEPGSQQALNPILSEFGLTLLEGQVIQPREDYPEETVFAEFAPEGATLGFSAPGALARSPVVTPGVTALRPSGAGVFDATPILAFDPTRASLRSEGGEALDGAALGFALEREIDGAARRLVVLGDADFMTSGVMDSQESGRNANSFLLTSALRWLSHGEYPIDMSRPAPLDNRLDLELHQVDYFKIVLYGVVPGTVFLTGAGLLAYRRRR